MQIRQCLCLAALVVALHVPAARAQSPGLDPDAIARLDVLQGWRTESGTHMAALRIRLAPGWKTYWRAPGDAGIPPRFDWTSTKNLSWVRFHWPTPEVFDQNGMRAVGYTDELVLPMEMSPRREGEPISLRAEVELGVCRDVCVPMSAELSAELSPGGGPDRVIDRALAQRPSTAAEAGVAAVSCRVEPIEDGLRVTASIDMATIGQDEIAVFELSDPTIWISEAAANRRGRQLVAMTEMVPPSNAPFFLDRSDVRITVLSAGRAVDIQGCPG